MTRPYVPLFIREGGHVARFAWQAGLSYDRCRWLAQRRWMP